MENFYVLTSFGALHVGVQQGGHLRKGHAGHLTGFAGVAIGALALWRLFSLGGLVLGRGSRGLDMEELGLHLVPEDLLLWSGHHTLTVGHQSVALGLGQHQGRVRQTLEVHATGGLLRGHLEEAHDWLHHPEQHVPLGVQTHHTGGGIHHVVLPLGAGVRYSSLNWLDEVTT